MSEDEYRALKWVSFNGAVELKQLRPFFDLCERYIKFYLEISEGSALSEFSGGDAVELERIELPILIMDSLLDRHSELGTIFLINEIDVEISLHSVFAHSLYVDDSPTLDAVAESARKEGLYILELQ
ncbi:hypothetical protein [Caulobacter sp. NIBR1757]|uniref:hypothetical protein n=1 Tax=Caulobacter sp. NIBR1757 TaxID=3016000 RepID=UPI0022F02F2F|nr:hypothetical protein [Caulobacter sp. NIBR1757]